MPVYLLTGPVVPNLWVTMYRINNSLGTIIACVCEYYERKRQLKNSKIVDTYRVTYTQKGVDPRSNGWKFERLGLFSALTSVAREITWPAMKWPTNKHCDKSEKERWRDTPWPWTQCLRHRTNCVELLSVADRRYEKFEKRRNWTSICGINPRRVSILPFERNRVSKRDFDYRPSTRVLRIRLRHYIHFDTFFDISNNF